MLILHILDLTKGKMCLQAAGWIRNGCALLPPVVQKLTPQLHVHDAVLSHKAVCLFVSDKTK